MIVLHRIEPPCNMRRFYALSLQPDLFGTVSVVKEWGRIGQPEPSGRRSTLTKPLPVPHSCCAYRRRSIGAIVLIARIDRGFHAFSLRPFRHTTKEFTTASGMLLH
jgi:hypothetical protein